MRTPPVSFACLLVLFFLSWGVGVPRNVACGHNFEYFVQTRPNPFHERVLSLFETFKLACAVLCTIPF